MNILLEKQSSTTLRRAKKRSWSLEDIQLSMQRNMQLHMTYFAQHVPAMEVLFEPDVTIVRSQIRDDYFNYVLSATFTENTVQTRINHVVQLFASHQLPFTWEVGELDTPSNLGNLLLASGFTLSGESPGMYLDLTHLEPSNASRSLLFQRTESLEQLQDFCRVVVSAGEHPKILEWLYSKVPAAIYQEGASLEMYVGYVDATPVVAGIVLFYADVVGIYYISTDPNHRRKGYATALMEHLLDRAKAQGYAMATLQATSEGKSLYKRLGFIECCQFREYAKAP